MLLMLNNKVLTFEAMDKVSVKIHMKTTEQYFPVVLFIMLYKVDFWMKPLSVTIQMQDTKQYFPTQGCAWVPQVTNVCPRATR